MPDLSFYSDRIARQQIEERVARHQASQRAASRKPRGRHALATRLHHLAERLDG